MLCQHDTQFHCYFAFCLKSPEYHVNQNELLFTCSFDIFLDWIVSRSWFQTSGIFTSRAFIRRCWNTFIYKIFIYIVFKTTDKKCHVLWTHINTHILSKTVRLIVLARTFEIYFEKAKSMQMHIHMLKKEFKNITFVYELRNAVKILNMLLIIKNKFSTFLLSLFGWYMS